MRGRKSIEAAFDKSYPVSPRELGARNADTDARVFLFNTGLPSSEIPAVRSVFLNVADPHVYPGVREMLREFMQAGDSVTIWTEGETRGFPEFDVPGYQGQRRKIVKSDIRRQAFDKATLSPAEKERFRVKSIERRKMMLLPEILADYEKRRIRHVIVAEDKSDRLLEARGVITRLQAEGAFTGTAEYVWMNQGRMKNVIPPHYGGTLDDLKAEILTVESLEQLHHLVRQLRAGYGGAPCGHILDWDHTLANETARKNEIRSILAERYGDDERVGNTPYLDPQNAQDAPVFKALCELLSIPPSRALIELLEGGSSDVNVFRVDWNGVSVVVKHTKDAEKLWRIRDEIAGYQMLRDSALPGIQEKLPKIHRIIPAHPVLGPTIIMEYLPGPNLRHAVRNGLLSDTELVTAHRTLLDTALDFWQSQPPKKLQGNGEWFSMQRAEWSETERLLRHVADMIARELNIPASNAFKQPFVMRSNGGIVSVPSLAELAHMTRTFIDEEPPVVLPLEYNDLSPGNAVAVKRGGGMNVRIVDPQWVRPMSDPAAELVRSIKIASAATARINSMEMTQERHGIAVSVNASVPTIVTDLEEQALARIPEFSAAIGDASLARRVRLHLVASHVREIALIAKGRGSLQQLGFNLSRIAHYLGLPYDQSDTL